MTNGRLTGFRGGEIGVENRERGVGEKMQSKEKRTHF